MSVHGVLFPGGCSSRIAPVGVEPSCNLEEFCSESYLKWNFSRLLKSSEYSLRRTSQVGCSSSRGTSSLLVRVYNAGPWSSGSSESGWLQRDEGIVPENVEKHEEVRLPKRTVALFWDLDNKPPNRVPAYDAALRVKRLAGEFGEVVDMVAYANQNAFTYVPARIREERQDRRVLDKLEKTGVVKAEHPYICSMCGRKSKTNVDLKRHFKQLHERERNKRLAYLGQLKGKKRIKYLQKVAPKESKYKQAARTVLVPKVGYGLASELKRAGVAVRTVEKRPQAADEALMRHMKLYINQGIEVICLISDDSDFLQILRLAKTKHVWTIVIGDTGTLKAAADSSFTWEDVASGRAVLTANERAQRWSNEDALRAELYDDDEFREDSQEEAVFSVSDEEEFQEFQRSFGSSSQLSPALHTAANTNGGEFAEEDDEFPEEDYEYTEDDDDEEEEGFVL